ncbi:hypothetical protein Zm00014a_028428 [Zea mays]|uniref:Uncharacterized protein n=1 Tax=Zea mays TaxID=4577 RepID=A0A317Y9Y5_MAIZE|nr:hypothetical protein Zm00014a_028428 [Zea mays]
MGGSKCCPVNWSITYSDKRVGGLGIKNIECFNRALRLRWLLQK